jgi:TPR repeat protein
MRPSASLFVTALVMALGLFAPAFAAPQAAPADQVTRDDYDAGLQFFRPAAERGDAGAQYNLGRLYSQGRGAAPDYAQAIVWFRKAAEQGHAEAQVRLADMLAKGQGAPRNAALAINWYRKAAAQGESDAAFALADSLGAAAPPAWEAPSVRTPTRASDSGRFPDLMNAIFGPGRWRETSGYRTVAAENRLRAEGALTVPAGAISRHSMGTRQAPGAYDVVVAGMSPSEAAMRIRRSGVAFRRLFPESAHGDQGPHLHVEPETFGRGF